MPGDVQNKTNGPHGKNRIDYSVWEGREKLRVRQKNSEEEEETSWKSRGTSRNETNKQASDPLELLRGAMEFTVPKKEKD